MFKSITRIGYYSRGDSLFPMAPSTRVPQNPFLKRRGQEQWEMGEQDGSAARGKHREDLNAQEWEKSSSALTSIWDEEPPALRQDPWLMLFRSVRVRFEEE